MPDITPGTKIHFTADQLGLVAEPLARYFESEIVNRGDEGIYESPHPDAGLKAARWHIVKVGNLYCPCHSSQFEVA